MANPKQKRSKSNTRARRANWKLGKFTISSCPQCKRPRRPHFACQHCGYYDGRLAIKQKDQTTTARPTKG